MEGCVHRDAADWIREQESSGATVVLVAAGSLLASALAIMDRLKPEAVGVVAALRALGLQCYMVTGATAHSLCLSCLGSSLVPFTQLAAGVYANI